MKRILRILGLGIAGIIVLAVVVGACTEFVARHRAESEYPAPGRLVDIGGRRIQIDCRGNGSPTVVMEAGLEANGSLAWSAVHDSVARTTRACAYSRAGIMWSDPAPGAFEPKRIADDLHAALAKVGEPPPYVMVGHSLGGPYIMLFTATYPSDVAGLVFVDASHPDQVKRFQAVRAADPSMMTMDVLSALSWTGIDRFFAPRNLPPGWPASMAGPRRAWFPTSMPELVAESHGLDSTLAAAGRMRTLGDRPLVVLTATKPYSAQLVKQMGISTAQAAQMQAIWQSLHDDEASWSSHSRHQLVPNATHYIQFDRPDVVIGAVREVVSEVRGQH